MRRLGSTRALVSIALALITLAAVLLVVPASAAPPANPPFQRTWERTDKPVADQQAVRTWMWGPSAFTTVMTEDYAQSPSGTRQVQYFDKSRMEITNPNVVDDGVWYVTNGLLVRELVTGQMQTGDSSFEPRQPAQVNVAGDPDDVSGPTYATFGGLQTAPAHAAASTITATLSRDGTVGNDPAKAQYGVVADMLTTETNHRIASVFWQFMNAQGTVFENGQFVSAPLFQNPYYATGYPIAEAYWATVKVGGQQRDVLLQCFERRCLTYTPANPAEWQVEMGNVGQHYFTWRYGNDNPQQQTATVINVVDGDTIDVNINGVVSRVRYIGVDTPEVFGGAQCYGAEASAYNRSFVEGRTVTLQKDVSETDQYGRLLRYVFVGDLFVNDALVRHGYAYAISYPPDVAYADQFAQAQHEAATQGRGLWSTCVTPTPTPTATATATTPPAPPATPTSPPTQNCSSAYPTVCIPPPPPDLDCGDIPYRRFTVLPPDPHGFDADDDGIGCESG